MSKRALQINAYVLSLTPVVEQNSKEGISSKKAMGLAVTSESINFTIGVAVIREHLSGFNSQPMQNSGTDKHP